MTVLSLARFVSLFPKPETLDQREKELTIYDDIQRIEEQLTELNAKLERGQATKDKQEKS